MALATPEASIGTGLAVGVVAYSVFQAHLPSVADVRTVEPGNGDVHAGLKSSAWQAAGATAAISLIARDATVFIIGGAITTALAWSYLHANAVNPATGRASAMGGTVENMAQTQAMALPAYDNVI
jgi:hypothetical protein